MFGDFILESTYAKYDRRLLLLDDDELEKATDYASDLTAQGYEVIRYQDDLQFRIEHDDWLSRSKVAIIAKSSDYIPYDIKSNLRCYKVSLAALFPKLNAEVLHEEKNLDYDLLCMAYRDNFDELRWQEQTRQFLKCAVYGKANVSAYLEQQYSKLMERVSQAQNYRDWLTVAEEKAAIDVMAVRYDVNLDTSKINFIFRDYILKDFGKLSQENSHDTPVLVSRAMEYMHDTSKKFVIIVMDGMSEFDWQIISESFNGIVYERSAAFAMIPTTTSISRQCLLSNKYPSQLIEPWKQSKEKAEFTACAKALGYTEEQIAYERGYNAEFAAFVQCGAVIINDIDDMVHGQQQGRSGMLQDVTLLKDRGQLATMTRKFLKQGFDVYISADHGNTLCVGLGKLMGIGLEAETKSHRMLVLQDFADKNALVNKYNLIDYPKYYLAKDYTYLICNVGESFDTKGETVMTHGGISIDECIVPLIKIKAGKQNG